MDYSSLERTDLPVLFFRASCDLGYAVDLQKGALAATLRNEAIFYFLVDKSAAWMDSHVDDLAKLDYEEHLILVRELIEAEMRRKRGASKAVYQAILAEFRPRTAADLAMLLETMATESHRLVSRAMVRFGGPESAARWARCPVADLRFVHGERGPTRCTFHGPSADPQSKAVISVRIGSQIGSHDNQRKGALRIYFNLRFYFFHEYVSHAFSIWQEEEFVEGYLMWAAMEMLFKIDRDAARHGFIQDSFKGRDYRELRKAEEVAHWFQGTINDRFLTFLLEWAADEITPHDPIDLDALHQVATGGDGNPQVIDKIEVAFQNPDTRVIRSGLRSLARALSGVPGFVSRLRPVD